MPQFRGDDRIFRTTRILAAVIVPFLVVAFTILYFRPNDTDQLFAWAIKPSMTSMMLGAVYIGGAYFFVRVLGAKEWHHVKLGFLPVAIFASVLGIATFLHWDRFNHSHIAFFTWAVLYFTTPFLVFAAWLHNRRTDPGTLDTDDVLLLPAVRCIMGVVGLTTVVVSGLLFLQPDRMIAVWPWKLTPLTARVVGAMFALGGAGLGISTERRWSAVRILLQAEAFMLFMILTAAVRGWSDFAQSNPAGNGFVGGLVALLVVIVVFYVSMEGRRGKAHIAATGNTHAGGTIHE